MRTNVVKSLGGNLMITNVLVMGNGNFTEEIKVQNQQLLERYKKNYGSKLKIALIDDDEMCLKVMRHQLDGIYKGGVEIGVYHSYNDFLKTGEKPDVVILDYMYEMEMGQLNGLSLIVKLKMYSPSSAIFMVTGHKHMNVAIQAMKSGAVDFISKGEGCIERLNENINTLLNKKLLGEKRVSLLEAFAKKMRF